MAEDTKPIVPVAVVDPDQLRDIMARLEGSRRRWSSTPLRSA